MLCIDLQSRGEVDLFHAPKMPHSIFLPLISISKYTVRHSCANVTQKRTRKINGLVHHELFSKADVTEVFLALANSNNFTTLVKHLSDNFFACILRQTTNKHSFTAWRPLSGRGRWKICKKHTKQVTIN